MQDTGTARNGHEVQPFNGQGKEEGRGSHAFGVTVDFVLFLLPFLDHAPGL